MNNIIEARSKKQEARSKKQEARSKKQEARSKKQEHRTQNAGVIHCMMAGRLGNQLFRYAFARALKAKFYRDYQININFASFEKLPDQLKHEGFTNSLEHFRIPDVNYLYTNPRKNKTFMQLALCFTRNKILRKFIPGKFFPYIDTKILQPFFNLFGLYNSVTCSSFIKPRSSRSRSIYCDCISEHARYFDEIRDILLEEFTPKYDVLPHNKDFLDVIQNCNSVCVAIRRGDFFSPELAPAFAVCNEEYFITAMKLMREEVPDCKFFVFTDDAELVRKTIHFPFEVEYQTDDCPVWEKLRLMYNCKHFIIGNSTFEWWAQYLGRNDNKIVYAPTPWHWVGEKWEGMYLPYMRTVECHKS